MTHLVSGISVAQAATIINVIVAFIQFTVSLSAVILLIYFMPKTNTALSWSSISRILHSSLWPTILQTDSSSTRASGTPLQISSHSTTLATILVAVAGVLLPLGLSEGPTVFANPRQIDGRYVPDTSPLGLSTTPDQSSFVQGRQCGGFGLMPCPGNDNPNTTTIAPSIRDIFNSTPHGPFAMEFRRFHDSDPARMQNCSIGVLGSAQSFISRNDTFVSGGVIIDMSLDHPGIGFWDQSVPEGANGVTWSQDVLWLEPVTECVNTNLTIEYFLMDSPDQSILNFNLTDNGGFAELSPIPPTLNRDGQHIDIKQHAYTGAGYSNLFAMLYLNLTRESSFVGASYPVNTTNSFYLHGTNLGNMNTLPLSYLNETVGANPNLLCQGYGGEDTANITNVHVTCGIALGPPLRTDGGDPRMFSRGLKWKQDLHGCASTTRASIQTIIFSTNNTANTQNIQVSRESTNSDVLWATEKTEMNITDVDLFWGRVDNRYENDPSLWTTRADALYLPAGSSSIFPGLAAGLPAAAHAYVWSVVYAPPASTDGVMDYSGKSDFGLRTKFQSLVAEDSSLGNAQIHNLIWTDIMSNNLIGFQINHSLVVSEHLKTIQYDFKYAIPAFVLLLIWMPSLLGATFLLITRFFTFGRMRMVLNHTSIGRVVTGTSALHVQSSDNARVVETHHSTTPQTRVRGWPGNKERANAGGDTKVALDLFTHTREVLS